MDIMNILIIAGVSLGIVVSIFAVIYMYLTRSNILKVLNRDQIFFDNNFEIKKTVISNAMSAVDNFLIHGRPVRENKQFLLSCKKIYNEMICVCSNLKLAQKFYDLTLSDEEFINSEKDIYEFKILCRAEMGYSVSNKEKNALMNQTKGRGDIALTPEVRTLENEVSFKARQRRQEIEEKEEEMEQTAEDEQTGEETEE